MVRRANLLGLGCLMALAAGASGWSSVATAAAATAAAAAATATPASRVPADIAAIFDEPKYKGATWGLRVLDGSKVLVDLNSDKQLLIGSVRKIYSVGELLDTVGPSHTYDTPVYRDGTVKAGILHGNLIVQASGDLTMGGRTNPDGSIAISDWDHNEAVSLGNAILTAPDPLAGYRALARSVKAAGIDRVDGDVVIDDRLFVPFAFRDELNVRPIFVNDDCVDLSIVPGAKAGVTYRPQSAALTIRNELETGPHDTLKIAPLEPSCIGTPGCSATIGGTLPATFVPPLTGRPELVQTVRIVQPSNYARTVFIEALEAAGVAVGAKPVEPNPVSLLPPKDAYPADTKVAQLTGLPYADDAKLILKISYNMGADTSLVLFGVAHHVDSMPAALQLERATLASQYGIAPNAYHFVDGSGGGDTTATNVAVTQMLDELATKPSFQAFYDALPILSVDGSLAFVKDYQSDPTLRGAAGRVRAKTGTYVTPYGSGIILKGQALGGYVETKSGKRLTFELVVNDVPIASIDDITKVFQDQGTIAAILWRDY